VALVIGQLDVTLPDALKASASRCSFMPSLQERAGIFRRAEPFLVQTRDLFGGAMRDRPDFPAGHRPDLRVRQRLCRGIGAGALTATAMMGTAGDALARLGLSPDQLNLLNSQMAVGFAITYVFGTVGVIHLRAQHRAAVAWRGRKEGGARLEAELSEGGEVTRPGYITPLCRWLRAPSKLRKARLPSDRCPADEWV